MKRFKRFWLVASSLMLVLAMVTVLGTKPVHALVAAMVQVANTAANPIPVTGAVGISGTADVNVANQPIVRFNGPAEVIVVKQADVLVGNTSANPIPVTGAVRDLDNPARSPFHATCIGRNCSISIPAGKRLVVENIFGQVTAPPGEKLLIQMEGATVPGGDNPNFTMFVPAVFQGVNFGGPDVYLVNHLTRIYLDHNSNGDSVFVTVFTEPDFGVGNLDLNVIGYLVSLP